MAEASGRILLIENCDFRAFPPGGQLTFARHLIRAFGDRLALVGASTDGEPVGQWIERDFEDHRIPFLSVGPLRMDPGRPLIPSRLRFWLRLRRHRQRILALGARHAIALAPETMMALRDWGLEVCYHFSGVDNPLSASRYRWARPLARWFDARHLTSAGKAALLLAHADPQEIEQLAARSRGRLSREQLHWFPTCVDTDLFRPRPKIETRRQLGLSETEPLLMVAGRISCIKGWDLALEAFARFREQHGQGVLCFVGDGEDRSALEAAARRLGVDPFVMVTGFQPREAVALWWNAADLAVVASHREGWSNAMLEALAAGKAVVSTEVGGARALIREGVNGFVVRSRDPEGMAQAIEAALALSSAESVSRAIAEQYSLRQMACSFRSLWPPLAWTPPTTRAAEAGWILGVRVESLSCEQVIERLLEWARRGESRYVCFATVYSLMLARDSLAYRQALDRADLVVPDGMPLVWALHRSGIRGATRVAGPDLAPSLMEAAEREQVPVGFYGGRPEVLAALVQRVRARFPRLPIAYAWAPPFRPLRLEEDERVVRQIRASGARILFVGLGTPKPDLWTAAHRGAIPAVMLGVGQVFDLMAGVQRRAPRWMRGAGLEWLFRLLMEPRRLWRRYLPHNPRFLWWLAWQWLGLGAAGARGTAPAGTSEQPGKCR